MSVLTGQVVSVETRNLSEPTVAAAAIGATVISVADASTFDENGGLVTLQGVQVAYLSTDTDADTITLAVALTTALDEQEPVEVWPAVPVKTATVVTDGGADAVTATVPHTLVDKFPDGVRDDSNAESVTLEWRGPYELLIADAVAQPLQQISLDFIDSEQGISLTTEVAQLQDVQALGSVAAPSISADALSIGGTDFQAIINSLPQGKLLEGRKSTGTAAGTIGTTEVACFLFNMGNLTADRSYRVTAQFHFQLTGTIGTEQYSFRFRYTTDGSEPTTSSAFLPNTKADHRYNPNANGDVYLSTPFEIASDAPVQVLLTAVRASGTTTGTIYQTAGALPLIMSLWDDGPVGALSTTAIKQRLGLAEGVPLSPYTKVFNATWCNAIDNWGNGLANSWMWIGMDDTYSAGAYGLVGFDSTAIVAALAGVVTPTQCTLRWRPRSRKASDGLDALILTHNYASYSASTAGYGGYTYTSDGGTVTSAGVSRSNAAPGTLYDNALGTTIFNQFKAGSRKGIGFAGVSSSAGGSAGSIYGDGSYQCQLIFTYQGTS